MQRISKIDPLSIANGPGFRVAVFVSGCRNACPGCFNTEAQNFDNGQPFDDETIDDIVNNLMDKPNIQGITILGGEPFEPENQPMILKLEKAIRQKYGYTKTIWIYTGFTIENLYNPSCRGCTSITDDILSTADVLVDGPFIESQKELLLKFKGSSNQRIIDLRHTNINANIIKLWDDGNKRGTID